MELPDLILGKYPYISFFVGSVLREPPPPNRQGPLHRIDLGNNCAAKNGMPIYTVVTGAPR
jgi:hypothetical protein